MLIATKVLVMDLYAVQYAITSNQKPKHKAKPENNSKLTKKTIQPKTHQEEGLQPVIGIHA